ncbi:MAG: response regulator [Myxococcota bacterium]
MSTFDDVNDSNAGSKSGFDPGDLGVVGPQVLGLKSIFEKSSVGLAICALDGGLVFANPSFLAMFSLSSIESVNLLYLIERYSPESKARLSVCFRGAGTGAGTGTGPGTGAGTGTGPGAGAGTGAGPGAGCEAVEASFVVAGDADCDERWVEISSFPIRDDEGVVQYVGILSKNITAQRIVEGLIRQTQKLETISTMASGLAHEFNNILSGIVGYTSLLAARFAPDSSEHKMAITVLEAVERAVTTTGLLMTIGRQTIPVMKQLNIEELLATTLDIMRPTAPQLSIELIVEDDVKPIYGDRPLIEQAVVNLVTNAANSMPRGGKIQIAVNNLTLLDDGSKPLPHMPGGEYVVIAVSDKGNGVLPEHLARFFDPYFLSQHYPGYGPLGMAVVQGISKIHRGYVLVDSAVGHGTTVSLYFPVGEPFSSKRTISSEMEALAPAVIDSKSILIVDDDSLVRNVLIEILKGMGHKTLHADDVEAALELVVDQGKKVDLMLVDVFMPGRSGLDLVDELRNHQIDTPVILVTGLSVEDVETKAKKLKATSVLSKPFGIVELEQALSKALA